MTYRLALLLAFLPLAGCPSTEADCNGHAVGDSYPSGDGCNTCSCTADGEVCTVMACAAPDAGSSPADAGENNADGGGTPAPDAGAPARPENACQNDSDLAAHQQTFGDQNKTIGGLATDCAISCFMGGRGDDPSCVTECLLERTENAVSGDCATCYAASAGCAGTNNCAGACLADAEAPACVTCRCGQDDPSHANCYEVFAACSGFPPSNSCE